MSFAAQYRVSKWQRIAGFTLIEVMMVVAVGGILSAVSVPALSGAMRRYEMNTASRMISAEIRAARFTAVAKNRTMRVRFNCPGPGQFRVIEVVGNAGIDNAADRCSETAYPYPRSGPRNLDSGLSEISIVFQAAVPKPVVPKYTTSGVRRPSEL